MKKLTIMKNLLFTLALVVSFSSFGQNDWKLPINNGKIQFEFNSKKLNSGKKDLCELYTATNTLLDLNAQLASAMTNGKVKFFSSTNFRLTPSLSGADFSTGNMTEYIKNIQNLCKTGNDTLIGSLSINIVNTKLTIGGLKARSGSIKCLYRIILKDDTYNIKFRGFKYTFRTKAGFIKGPELTTVALEDEYDEINIKRADKKFWSDIKMLVTLYNSTLEEVIGSQGSDFDFDD
jgi:hypothetical protein